MDAQTAASDLEVSRARLYQLRTDFLRNKVAYQPKASGGNHRGCWPKAVVDFLKSFVPLQSPPNFQLVADELLRLHDFRRSRSNVSAYINKHLSYLLPHHSPKARIYRRFRRAHIGELWQHDSSIHQWWPAPQKQVLLLTIDDASGFNVAGRFVDSDTTWHHFCHFRAAFEKYGLPQIIYTDGLSLFGPSGMHDHQDPKTQFQRALKALGVAHLVAPTPQAKGKIERRFGTFQKRLVTLLAHAKVKSFKHADQILQMEISRQNNTRQRSSGLIPEKFWQEQMQTHAARLKPAPNHSLLDLHLSLRCTRNVNNDHTVDFDGSSYEISATKRKKITVLYHPNRQFWILEHSPTSIWPPILGHFSSKNTV